MKRLISAVGAVLALAALVGCANPAAEGLKETQNSVNVATYICGTAPPTMPGKQAPYWDCMRTQTSDAPDANLSWETAQHAKLAEDYDAGKLSQSDYDLQTAGLRVQDQNVYGQRTAQANATSTANTVGVIGGLAAAASIAADIFFMVNY